MNDALSPNTQAILLLTAPLIVGRAVVSEPPLTAAVYNRLAVHLRDAKRQPADLLTARANEILRECTAIVDQAQVQRLLKRGFLLSQAVEHWRTRAIWVMSRADGTYPRRLKTRLNGAAPPVLYGCGEVRLLETGGLAVVGSRNVDDSLIAYTQEVARLAADAQQTIVSGGARGVDQAAMRGALQHGGKAVGILADSLERAAMHRDNRDALLEERLVLASPYDPSAGFNVGHAMQRNKLIYALADAALVVNADLEKGGTWAGATEQLDKHQHVRVYVRASGEPSAALDALRQHGAEAWPNPLDAESLTAAVRAAGPAKAAPAQAELGWGER